MENTIVYEKSEPAKDLRESINLSLKDKYGIDTLSGLPMWRIAWTPAQYAKQLGTYRDFTDSGIFIREITEVRERPKYDYLGNLYVLELLQIVVGINAETLPTQNLSYECITPFMHKITEKYLPPNQLYAEFVIDAYYAGLGKKSMYGKYVSNDGGNSLENKRRRIQEIYKYLYGNETSTTDALAYGTGVVVPHKQFTGEL